MMFDRKETVSLSPSSRISRAPKQISASFDGSTVLLSVESGKYFGFDEIGEDIWRLVESPIGVEALVNDLAARYDAPRNAILSDVTRFVEKLVAAKLIVVEAGEAKSAGA